MECIKNGIKRYGESYTLNNNCIYPNCMKNKECYLVMVSCGEWEDNVKFNTGAVFLSFLSAEKELEKIKNYYTTEEAFPFDHCTEEEFKVLLYEGKVLEEEEVIFDEWVGEKQNKSEFRYAWIQNLNLED